MTWLGGNMHQGCHRATSQGRVLVRPSQGGFWNLLAFFPVCTASPRALSSSRCWALERPEIVGRQPREVGVRAVD